MKKNNAIKGSNDYCFKAIAHYPEGKEVEILEFIDTELGKVNKNLKNKRTDIIVKIDGVIANVEVNTNDYIYPKYFRNFVYLIDIQ